MSVRRDWLVLACAVCVSAIGGTALGQNAAALDRDAAKKDAAWFLRGRAQPAAAALRYRAIQQKLAVRQLAPRATHASAAAGWTPLGPAPLVSDASGDGFQDYNFVSGRATSIAIDRADATGNTVYIGGAYGGVWKSTNAGPLSTNAASVAWTPLIDNQATLSVGAIAIQPQPTNPDATKSVVLVGTGETDSSTDSYYGLGILRSADAGQSWKLITGDTANHSFAGLGFSQIAFSSSNTSLAVAAAAGTSLGEIEGIETPQTNLGLYYSSDAGQSWSAATIVDGTTAIAPGSATAVVYNAGTQTFFAALRFHGFYTSSDGIHWARLTNQPGSGLSASACPPIVIQQSCPIYRGQIAVVAGRSEMYVWYVDANDVDQGIFESIDGGTTWTQINETGITACGDLIGGCGTQGGSYNLTLAAVPSGTGTDLYAGAVNLYKCSITSGFPTCTPAGNPAPPASATFLNLTHVYGCSSIAKVHPAQHAIDALVLNGGTQVLMYFANDGGIYRALDGYSDLISGTCGTPNQFDSLNQTLGSMTQFVSLAEHPSDANTIFGGTQGNGSAASSSAAVLNNSSWISVNSADGGYSEINPADPTEWFTANTGVSIQRCESGIGCHAQDFEDNLVVSAATLGGDEGSLYTPYALDPQNSSELIVGTCRVWRGTTSGAGFGALSNNFESGGSATCTGGEINLVRSLAAGGAKDSSGFSNVIYAGTDGFGPFAPSSVPGGRVWGTTNAVSGASSWADRTGAMNPSGFPISGIGLDRSDASGNTAYVTIMGFGPSHVWQTSNAGATWTDFTGNLPNAPANAVLVDAGTTPAAGTVYVATDAGVFFSSTGAANWTEVGPAPAPEQVGYLPNVPVIAMRLFSNGGTKLLRAATYGRGVWQFPLATTPDFQIAIPQPSQTIFAAQTATFSGLLSEFNGYSSEVTLSCAAGDTPPPSQCAAAAVTPTPQGTRFTLTASGAPGDYSFLLTGVGPGASSGASPLTHNVAVTLHIVDFTLSAPSPAAITLAAGQSSGPIALHVGFAGPFPANGTVDLSCAPVAGVSCSFSSGGVVTPAQGNPATVTLTVAAANAAPDGTFSLNISATSDAADAQTLDAPLQLTVVSQGYSLAVPSLNSPVPAGQNVSMNGMAMALNGYNSTVKLSCAARNGGAMPSSCSVSPATVTPNAGGAAFSVNVSNGTAGSFAFNVHGVGQDGTTIDTPVTLNVYDFTVSASTGAPVSAGQTGSFTITLSPLPAGAPFAQNVGNFTCSGGLPTLASCAFNSNQISSGSNTGSVTLTIHTTAAVAGLRGPATGPLYAAWLPVGGIALMGMRKRKWIRAGLGLVALLMMFGCGGGLTGGTSATTATAQPGTFPGTYAVQVSATEGTLTRSATATLVVR